MYISSNPDYASAAVVSSKVLGCAQLIPMGQGQIHRGLEVSDSASVKDLLEKNAKVLYNQINKWVQESFPFMLHPLLH